MEFSLILAQWAFPYRTMSPHILSSNESYHPVTLPAPTPPPFLLSTRIFIYLFILDTGHSIPVLHPTHPHQGFCTPGYQEWLPVTWPLNTSLTDLLF